MPSVDRSESQEGGEKGKKSSSSKTKDLSHVPCKFFKVGSCTAGSSCPFSHAVSEPGAQKDVCAWFVKGNCKFGHKCALAHVLPGQPMTMDRKNKKAAQLAAGGGKESSKGGGRSGKRDAQGRPPITMSLKASISPSAPAPALKDTDFASFGALDESNKLPTAPAHTKQADQAESKPAKQESQTPPANAVPVSSPRRSNNPDISPTQPAKDFGPIGSPPRAGSSTTSPTSHPHPVSRLAGNTNGNNGGFSPGTSPSSRIPNGSGTSAKNSPAFLSTSPFSAPGSQSIFLNYSEGRSGSGAGGIASSLGSGMAINGGMGMNRGNASGVNTNTSTGNNANPSWGSLGNSSDIGSLPVLGAHVPPRLNGAGVGTTGTNVGKDFDLGFEYEEYLDSGIAGGVAARRAAASAALAANSAVALDDGDMEDFLPSSLTDLLTPEERSRRMSRSNSGQGESAGLTSPTKRTLGVPLGGQPSHSGSGNGHRYSRSVPAPSLLGDISSIWSNNNSSSGVDTPTSSGLPSSPSRLGGFGNGTPSSFTSASGMLHEEYVPGNASPSLLSPSNASAAFLPGLHHQYLKSKQQQGLSALSSGLGRGMRGASNPLFASGQASVTPSSRLGVPTGSSPSGAPSPLSAYGTPKTADNPLSNYIPSSAAAGLGSQLAQQQRTIPSHLNNATGIGGVDDPHILSPSSRALQAHAPGQSLPQGLAAGYSRIHALPPVASPGSIGSGIGSLGAAGFSISPGVVGAFNIGPYGSTQQQEWNAMGAPPGLSHGQVSSAQHQHYLNSGLTSPNHPTNFASNNAPVNSNTTGNAELDAMFKLSYSAAASKGGQAGSGTVLTPHKNLSSNWGQPPSAGNVGSGLGEGIGASSGAVTSGDDDDLFVLDR